MRDLPDGPAALDGRQAVQVSRQIGRFRHGQAAQLKAPSRRGDWQVPTGAIAIVVSLLDET